MTRTIDNRWAVTKNTHDSWQTRVAVALVLVGSTALLLLATPESVPGFAYWAISSIALAAVLILFVAGERTWDRMVATARAEGVVER